MKILSIGNSFSQNAQTYLHKVAKLNGVKVKTVNLFIGGCPLRTHYLNMLNDAKAYTFSYNGENVGLKVSISEALSSDDWDVVTLQQASIFSGDFDTYTPHIEELAEYVRTYCPKAKIVIHETWAYANGCEKLAALSKYPTARDMYGNLHAAYKKAAEAVNADGIIPAGTAMIGAAELGIKVHHDDGAHAGLGCGKYLLALCWLKYLTGKDIDNDSFNEFDAPVTEEERALIIKAVNEAVKESLR
jgi:hypothetical protein